MRPLHTVLGSILLAATTTACAPTVAEQAVPTAAPNTTAPAEVPPGFYFDGEFVTLGDFDPEGPVDLINMCDHLPDEVLHKAGMKRVEGLETSHGPYGITCVLQPSDETFEYGEFEIMTDAVPVSRFLQSGYILDSVPESTTPGAFTHVFSSDGFGSECWASVSTDAGRVGVGFSSFSPISTQAEFCEIALRGLDSLYTQLRGV